MVIKYIIVVNVVFVNFLIYFVLFIHSSFIYLFILLSFFFNVHRVKASTAACVSPDSRAGTASSTSTSAPPTPALMAAIAQSLGLACSAARVDLAGKDPSASLTLTSAPADLASM